MKSTEPTNIMKHTENLKMLFCLLLILELTLKAQKFQHHISVSGQYIIDNKANQAH